LFEAFYLFVFEFVSGFLLYRYRFGEISQLSGAVASVSRVIKFKAQDDIVALICGSNVRSVVVEAAAKFSVSSTWSRK
jgi:hypothetical protein